MHGETAPRLFQPAQKRQMVWIRATRKSAPWTSTGDRLRRGFFGPSPWCKGVTRRLAMGRTRQHPPHQSHSPRRYAVLTPPAEEMQHPLLVTRVTALCIEIEVQENHVLVVLSTMCSMLRLTTRHRPPPISGSESK